MGLIPIVASILSLIAAIEKLQTPDPLQLANARTSLAEVLLGLGEITDAEAQIQQAMAIAEMDDLGRLRADCMRGALLAARHNWHDAEPVHEPQTHDLCPQFRNTNIARFFVITVFVNRVAEGIRTPDFRNHNPTL